MDPIQQKRADTLLTVLRKSSRKSERSHFQEYSWNNWSFPFHKLKSILGTFLNRSDWIYNSKIYFMSSLIERNNFTEMSQRELDAFPEFRFQSGKSVVPSAKICLPLSDMLNAPQRNENSCISVFINTSLDSSFKNITFFVYYLLLSTVGSLLRNPNTQSESFPIWIQHFK